jgi:hypothetical protein
MKKLFPLIVRWIQLINAKAFWLLNFCKYTSFGELN